MDFQLDFQQVFTVTFTLFAIIDIIGSVPILISLKEKMGGIQEAMVVMIAGLLMLLFLFVGDSFLKLLGLDIRSFAIGGSIVIFLLGFEMVSGQSVFKGQDNAKAGSLVPIAFPIIAGSGTLTTIMSLKANYDTIYIAIGIVLNLLFIYIVLKSLKLVQRVLGEAGMIAVHKFFGIVLLAIAVKIFTSNIAVLFKTVLAEIAK